MQEHDAEETTKYTGEFPRSEWKLWKDTVPRSRNLEDRLTELIELDRKVQEQGGAIEEIVADFLEQG